MVSMCPAALLRLLAVGCWLGLVQVNGLKLCKDTSAIDIRGEQGVRIEPVTGSRAEYDPLPAGVSLSPGSTLELKFQTRSTSGLLFALLDYKTRDIVSAFLHRGRIIFARQCSNGNVFEMYRVKLNNGQWHTVKYEHTSKGGRLIIDGKDHFRQYHMGPCARFRTAFMGGLPESMTFASWPGPRSSFVGCLKDMRLNGRVLETAPKYFVVSVCGQGSELSFVSPLS